MTTDTMPRARRPKVASLLAEFGPTLDAFLLVARAHATMRAMSLRPPTDPALDKLMKRRVRKIETASDARMKALARRDWKTASAAAAEIRKASRELQTMRDAQLAAIDAGRSSLEASLMATIRGEVVEEVETSIVDWLRDEDGARKIKRGRAILVEERAKTIRVRSRTGLMLAFRNGHLENRQVRPDFLLNVGMQYHEAYEQVLKFSEPIGSGREPSSGHGQPSTTPADRRLQAANDLATMRKDLTARQRRVLDLVCGDQQAVRAASETLRIGHPALKASLVAGLIKARENLAKREAERRAARGIRLCSARELDGKL